MRQRVVMTCVSCALAVAFAALLLGCSSSPATPDGDWDTGDLADLTDELPAVCEGVDCGPGECRVADEEAYCSCPEGFHQVGKVHCVVDAEDGDKDPELDEYESPETGGEEIDIDPDNAMDPDTEMEEMTDANETDREIIDAGLTWVSIPGGTFRMGCVPQDGNCYADEVPRHAVVVSPFEMTQTKVTQDQYHLVTGQRPSYFRDCGGDCPVEFVDWDESKSFCEAVGGRLPSEAEWEYAARAGTVTIFICGNYESCVDSIAWIENNSDQTTHPVGLKTPNPFGLYDMLGNLLEWVEDCSHDNYNGAPSVGSAWEEEQCCVRVLRGASWDSYGAMRASGRSGYLYSYGLIQVGFRCARD